MTDSVFGKTINSPGDLKYGNWIRKKVLVVLSLGVVGFGILAVLPLPPIFRVIAGIFCAILFVSFLYPLYAYYLFSPKGGNLQDKFYNLIIASLGDQVKGSALDIGSGNGVLAVRLAQRHPVQVVGMDYWGKNWEYSRTICEENARIGGVSARVHFSKGDAASLDFADGSFDAVVSNLTFHEVKSARQKTDVVREALRVLKPSGMFAFVDYFYDSQYYGDISEFQNFLQHLDLARAQVKPLREVMPIPRVLLHPKILGKVGIVYGAK
ncbi:MAG: class I SAM-dependent methyltransferase [Chloroflexi bacterium]|nr:class I SAM-dependent methyltransferase [Chloroflexota bacterium]